MKTYVLYHAGCADGFGAALAAWLALGEGTPEIRVSYVPVQYGEPVPTMEDGSDVYIVDFSYPAAELSALGDRMRVVLVLDHHHTAKRELAELSHPRVQVEFNNEKSGAVLAWEFFFPQQPVPLLLRYVQDRDLWQWLLPESREVSAALASYPRDFQTWGQLLDEDGVELLRQEGRVALRVTSEMARRLACQAAPVTLAGVEMPAVNTAVLQSEVCHELLTAYGFQVAACWYEKGGARIWSLRSRPGVDCSVIAKKYGGGGHAQACGFTEEEYVRVTDVTAIRCADHRNVPPLNRNEAAGGECGACIVERAQTMANDEGLRRELLTYLDGLTITGDNIGEVRRTCFVPWDSAWNGIVRDETAAREGSAEGGAA